MSGGSGHGNAIGRGQEGINQNLQSQMAQTGYDAYNRDLDRQLGIAGDKDTMNQQRAGWDQQNSFNTQNANQQNRFQVGQANQGNQFKYDEANQGSDLQAQMANLQNMFQTNQANQGANLSAQQGNQQANIQAGQANQNYAQQQQQQLGDLMGQQQGSFSKNRSKILLTDRYSPLCRAPAGFKCCSRYWATLRHSHNQREGPMGLHLLDQVASMLVVSAGNGDKTWH